MTEISIRRACAADMPIVLELVRELAEYERAADEVTVTVDQLVDDGFERNLFQVLLAEVDGEVGGMAFYYPRYSTWKGRTIHLEDLVVKDTFRRHGLGRRLFEAVLHEAHEFGAKRLEWTVLEWNEPALKFYERFDAEMDREWYLGRLREAQIAGYSFGQPVEI